MNKKRLVEIIKDPGIASNEEIQKLKELSSEYSYASFLKVLRARLDNLNDDNDKVKSLSKAAIYIADRTVLKNFITHDKTSPNGTGHKPYKSSTLDERADKEKEKLISEKDRTRITQDQDSDDEVSGEVVKTIKESIREVIDKKDIDSPDDSEDKLTSGKITEESDIDTVPEEKIISQKVKTPEEEISSEDTLVESKKETATSKETDDLKEKIKDDQGTDSDGVIAGEKPEENDQPESKISEEIHDESTAAKAEEIEKGKGAIPVTEADEKIAGNELRDKWDKEEVSGDSSGKIDRGKVEDHGKHRDDQDSGEDDGSTLSSEILKNISEMRKSRKSLFSFLDMENPEGQSEKKTKSEKSHKKQKKGKKNEKKTEDEGGTGTTPAKGDQKTGPEAGQPDMKRATEYPGYEEEDPKVIKDFLDKLEEESPPPKKKMKKEDQEKLIEKFIESEPKIKSVRSSKEMSGKKDLSLPSVKFRDDLISESLANIMIKQGKLEKAIDIYKKLIWKFPQKKAYFATQIEELKKKSEK